MAQIVIAEGDILRSNNSSNRTAPDVGHQAYVSGDLLIQCLIIDDDLPAFPITTPSAGPNGETLILDTTGYNGGSSGPSMGVIAWVGDATVAASTWAWTIGSTGQQWEGRCIHVPAGEFDAASPLGVLSGYAGNSSIESTLPTPAWTAGSTDGTADGNIVVFLASDFDPIDEPPPSGWTLFSSADGGAIAAAVGQRTAKVTNSESIASVNYVVDSAYTTSIGIIIRATSAAPDTTAPVLTSASVGTKNSEGGILTFTTDEANGTAYWMMDTNASRTAAQVKSGGGVDSGNVVISSTGVKNMAASTGGSASTGYYLHGMHEDAATNQSNVVSVSFTTNAASVTVTDVDTDEIITNGQTGIVITGTVFEASQGSGSVVIDGVTQTVTSWASTSITITHVLGAMKFGAQSLVVTNDSSDSDSIAITVNPASGKKYVDIVSPGTGNGYIDVITSAATGDQLEYDGGTDVSGFVVVVNADASFSITGDPAGESFDVRVWDAVSPAWTAFATQSGWINTVPTGKPAVSGTTVEGETLTASVGSLVDDDGIGSIAYQWQKGTTNIGGATNSTYVSVSGDIGSTIRVGAVITDDNGAVETVIYSLDTGTIENPSEAPVMPANESVNVIEGNTAVGNTSTASGTMPIVYSLETPADTDDFYIDSSTAALTFKTEPDFDNVPTSYTPEITATNGTNPTDTQIITITIINTLEADIIPPSNSNIEYEYGTDGVAHTNPALIAWLATAVTDGEGSVSNNLASQVDPLVNPTLITFSATDAGDATATATPTEASPIATARKARLRIGIGVGV